MKGMRSALLLFMALTMLSSLLVAGCGSTEVPEATSAPEPTAVPEATEPEEPTEAAAEPGGEAGIDWRQFEGTQVTFLGTQHPWNEALEVLIPEFEELTGIDVVHDVYSDSEFQQKRLISLSSGDTTPDLFFLDQTGVLAEAGWIEPLDKYFGDASLIDDNWYKPDDVFAGAWGWSNYKGVQYGVPITAESETLFYRTDIFEELGLEVPETFDKLYETAKTIKEQKGIAGFASRGTRGAGLVSWPWTGFVLSFGGHHMDVETYEPTYTDPKTVEATEFYAKILQDTGPEGVANYNWTEVVADFSQGQVAMITDSSNFIVGFNDPEQSQVAGNVGLAIFPHVPGMDPSPNQWYWQLGMNANSENKEATFLLMEWLSSPEITMRSIELSGITPQRESVMKSDLFIERNGGPEAAEAIVGNLLLADPMGAKVFLQHPKYAELDDDLTLHLQRIIAGEVDAQTGLEEAQQNAEAILDD